MSSRCPTNIELEALLKGDLAQRERDPVEQHLEECAACRQKLDSLAGGGRSWLKGEGRSDDPNASPPLQAAMDQLKAGGPPDTNVELSEHSGELVGGRYKLLQRLGEGGMGEVWMAEQSEPVRRRVALKLIKLGMDTKEVVARFEAERQALAMMDHPNIAKVLDGGATENGRPYFVMELVRGVRITEWCDEKKLSMRARLDLFIQVCQAIQHAHQKGIIHRDIKPSNVLVTMNDGVTVPKVIDFGVAKATSGQQLTDKTLFTAFEQFIGTPAYMSPEQAVITNVDIDTRSDIYALGVLLYELLTGKTPFDAKELLAIGLDEIRRTIREQEPPRPSTRLSTLPGQELSTTAQRRGLDAPKLVSELRGDLDWIVMKALEKDRARRYETASGLAMDIQRHLNNEPVAACPPSRLYRLKKTVRRNKVALAVAATIAAILIVATSVSLWQAVRATQAKALATQRLTESDAIAKFLTEIFQSPDPRSEGHALTVAETLERAAQKLDTDLSYQPARRARLQATLGTTCQGLGLYPLAVHLRENAHAYCHATLGPEHSDTIEAMQDLAVSYWFTARYDEALKLREEVLAMRRKMREPEDLDTIWAMYYLAISYDSAKRGQEAVKLLEEVMRVRRKALGPEDTDTISAMHGLANGYFTVGRAEEALQLREAVVPLRRKVTGPEHPYTIDAMLNLSSSYHAAGRLDEAIKVREEALSLYRKVNGAEHPRTLDAMLGLARYYEEAGRFDEASKLSEEALSLKLEKARRSATDDPVELESRLEDLAEFRYRHKQYGSAELLHRERIQSRFKRPGAEGSETVISSTASLGRLFSDWAWDERTINASSACEHARESERLLREVLLLRLRDSTNSWGIGDSKSRLGGALVSVAATDPNLTAEAALAKFSEAESLLLEGHEQLQKISTDKNDTRDSLQRLVRLYWAWNKLEKRVEWKEKLELLDKAPRRAREENGVVPAGLPVP